MSPKSRSHFFLRNNQGQSLIESLVMAVALGAFLCGLGGILYWGFVQIGMNYLLHEYLVCEITAGESQCRQALFQKSRPLLFAAQIQHFESSSLFGKRRVRLILQMPLKTTLTLRKEGLKSP